MKCVRSNVRVWIRAWFRGAVHKSFCQVEFVNVHGAPFALGPESTTGSVIYAEIDAKSNPHPELQLGLRGVLPSGQTVAEWMIPQIEQSAMNGVMPKLLPLKEGK